MLALPGRLGQLNSLDIAAEGRPRLKESLVFSFAAEDRGLIAGTSKSACRLTEIDGAWTAGSIKPMMNHLFPLIRGSPIAARRAPPVDRHEAPLRRAARFFLAAAAHRKPVRRSRRSLDREKGAVAPLFAKGDSPEADT